MTHFEAHYPAARIEYYELIASLAKPHISDADWHALLRQLEGVAEDPQPALVARVFTGIPRIVSAPGNTLTLSLDEAAAPDRHRLPLVVRDWKLTRLLRVWMLMQVPKMTLETYVKLIERLFMYGEMDELTALYSALPVLHYPDAWRQRCTEGIRSNIGIVRDAVMMDNPYPAAYLDEGAWNQLILKAFFTDTDIHRIIGVEKRNNARLGAALIDYAYERHAAKRAIAPMLWLLAAPFIGERAFALMRDIVQQDPQPGDRKAIVQAFGQSNFAPAKAFLKENNELTD